jgi:two-component system nitrogen regulation sensor histidine kinase NtrY
VATRRSRRLWMTLGGVALVLLAAAVFTVGSLKVPLHAPNGNGFVVLFALSTFIFAAFLIFGLVLARSLVRLWTERRAGQLGSRFKTQMVMGAMGISLLPIVFLFFFSYALVNRTLNLWFPRPLEISAAEGQGLLDEWESTEYARLKTMASLAARGHMNLAAAREAFRGDADEIWIENSSGKVTGAKDLTWRSAQSAAQQTTNSTTRSSSVPSLGSPPLPNILRANPGTAEFWELDDHVLLAARAPLPAADGAGAILFGRRLPDDFLQRMDAMRQQSHIYGQQRERIRIYKKQILLALLMITVLLLSATTWVALFLAKLVTVPIQAMAEGTQEVARGNFDYRVTVLAQDELGALVASFNEMTAQLGDSRRQIDEFTRSLQQAVEERERRRQLMEAILENIPTGVVSLTPTGEISRVNAAAAGILGKSASSARTLIDLVGDQASREIHHLMRRALRLGVASREMELLSSGRQAHVAVTVSALGTRRDNPGYLLVIDDLTELLQAQKASAWQEVARRIAHEIKNPLTPIQLSAQRMLRYLERTQDSPVAKENGYPEFAALVAECSRLIEQEAGTLASLVDEFSQFVRFPSARLELADANAIVTNAIDVFRGRMEGISLRLDLPPALPAIRADAELLRRVIVNLIDNAAEALEDSAVREIVVSTRLDSRGGSIEITVSDTGRGISPEDKDRLFLPHFSTKNRGTGLGLAIASRIVAEHQGTLNAQDNLPMGTRFIVRLPVAEAGLGMEVNAQPETSKA